jgi:polar amino acid transport system substrate-binding protein
VGNTLKKRHLTARVWTALALIAAAIPAFVAAPAVARPLDDVVASKTLKVVVYDNNAPFSWADNGESKGIDVDLGRAIAKKLGVEAEIMLRMNGEKVDDDLRSNIWKGPLTGGGVGDVMLHVPTDRELAARNKETVIGNSYFQETIALAIDPKRVPPASDFQIFKTQKVGVKLATVSDYFLMSFEDGALIENIAHHVKGPDGAKEFVNGETAALLGVRSETEGLLHDLGKTAEFIAPAMDGIVRTQWVVGTAVNEKSRDLQYAIGNAITELKDSGALKEIFAKYGVTYIPPPGS